VELGLERVVGTKKLQCPSLADPAWPLTPVCTKAEGEKRGGRGKESHRHIQSRHPGNTGGGGKKIITDGTAAGQLEHTNTRKKEKKKKSSGFAWFLAAASRFSPLFRREKKKKKENACVGSAVVQTTNDA